MAAYYAVIIYLWLYTPSQSFYYNPKMALSSVHALIGPRLLRDERIRLVVSSEVLMVLCLAESRRLLSEGVMRTHCQSRIVVKLLRSDHSEDCRLPRSYVYNKLGGGSQTSTILSRDIAGGCGRIFGLESVTPRPPLRLGPRRSVRERLYSRIWMKRIGAL
ncbi:hypothetical protein C8Q76DRAFT_231395 [Earliella scabrosa]|nr:hypothetical protein C8Q76DRAFT_231395 [Earliella scabrosa]